MKNKKICNYCNGRGFIEFKHKFNQENKKVGCLELVSEMKLEAKNIAYIGDDESDIPCCSLIPFSFAVNDCHKDFKVS